MPVYSYRATDQSGKVVEGTLEAAEESGVVEKLHDSSLIPLRIQLPKETQAASLDISLDSLFGRISFRDVLIFTQELSTMVSAGLPLDRSLEIAVELTENRRLKEVVENVLKGVEGGSSLADALAGHPNIFSRLYVNMIRADRRRADRFQARHSLNQLSCHRRHAPNRHHVDVLELRHLGSDGSASHQPNPPQRAEQLSCQRYVFVHEYVHDCRARHLRAVRAFWQVPLAKRDLEADCGVFRRIRSRSASGTYLGYGHWPR